MEAAVQIVRPLGMRCGRVEAFLLSTLRDQTIKLYLAALAAFRDDLVTHRGIDWGGLSLLDRDMLLAE